MGAKTSGHGWVKKAVEQWYCEAVLHARRHSPVSGGIGAARKLRYEVPVTVDTMPVEVLACALFITFDYLRSTDKDIFCNSKTYEIGALKEVAALIKAWMGHHCLNHFCLLSLCYAVSLIMGVSGISQQSLAVASFTVQIFMCRSILSWPALFSGLRLYYSLTV